MIILIFLIIVFVTTLIKCAVKDLNKSPPLETLENSEKDDISELNRLERIENYDKQIDGYTQLIKLLDIAYLEETDKKKKAAILSKQLATLEKLNKTIEKREKLE